MTTESVFLKDKESTRALGVLTKLGRKDDLMSRQQTHCHAQRHETRSTQTFSFSSVPLNDLLKLLDADLLDQSRPGLLALGSAAFGTGSSASPSCHPPGFLRVIMTVHMFVMGMIPYVCLHCLRTTDSVYEVLYSCCSCSGRGASCHTGVEPRQYHSR